MFNLILGLLFLVMPGCGMLPQDVEVSYTDLDLRMPVETRVSNAERSRSDLEFQNLIRETAITASKSIQSLSVLEHASKPDVKKKPAPNPIKTGLDQRGKTIEWTGPVEPLYQNLPKMHIIE